MKLTQKVKEVKVVEKVHPDVASRRKWHRFGLEKGNATVGPDFRTTQLGEHVSLALGTAWKDLEKQQAEEAKAEERKNGGSKSITCRLCGGEHFTARCPFKDTLGGEGEADADGSATSTPEPASSSASGYLPPHLRGKPGAIPGRSRFEERDDSTTLRVTQLNEMVTEDHIRNELFNRYGPLRRVTLVRNRETGRSKGVAFVALKSIQDAEQAIRDLDGKGYYSLILRVEWSKPKAPR